MWTHRTPPRLGAASYPAKQSYFVTFCVYDRVKVFENPRAAECARETILHYRDLDYFYLPAYCIMPDHIHLLIIPISPTRHLSRIVATIKNATNASLKRFGLRVRWQWGYFDRILRRSESTTRVAEYIMMNPVRKGLVTDFRRWPYSGIVDRWF